MKRKGPKEAGFDQIVIRNVEICTDGGIAASDHYARKPKPATRIVREQRVNTGIDANRPVCPPMACHAVLR